MKLNWEFSQTEDELLEGMIGGRAVCGLVVGDHGVVSPSGKCITFVLASH